MNVKFSQKKENNSVYYFRERISLCSCDIVECRTNLMISTSHGLLNLQATIPSAISRFFMLLLCHAVSIVERSWFCCPHQIFIIEIHMKGKKENRKAKCILICCFIVEPINWHENFNLFKRNSLRSPFSDMRIFFFISFIDFFLI